MNSEAFRHILVEASLELLPPQMRRSLLDDRAFLEQWDIATAVTVTLGGNGPSFRRDRLYAGFRAAMRDIGRNTPVEDTQETTWNVTAKLDDDGLSFSIDEKGKRYSVVDHSALADDASVRTRWFDRAAKSVNFAGEAYEVWRERLAGPPLSDDEFAELADQLELTPVSENRILQSSFGRGAVNLLTLVPRAQEYYQRLTGRLGSAASFPAFVANSVDPHVADLADWDRIEGLRYSLLLCTAANVSDVIRLEAYSKEELLQLYERVTDHGDPISQIGAAEVALRYLERYPELEPFAERLCVQIIEDDPASEGGAFALLSSMVVAVGSELARTRALGDAPPFYRRQAAFAQASLIARAIAGSQVDPASVTQWSKGLGLGHIFFLQGLIDLRSEPRWLPDFIEPKQLKAEFIGRLSNAAEKNKDLIRTESLRALLVGQESRLVQSAQWPFPMLAGPMEGATIPIRPIPEDMSQEILKALEAERLDTTSFAGLVNTGMIYSVPVEHAVAAAKALRRVRYSIETNDEDSKVFGLIGGLAMVAAATRCAELADEVRILTRVLRRRKRFTADPDDEMRIAMTAAAAHESMGEWARFAGEWITEIAFATEDKDAARYFLPKLRRLVDLEPELARYCAQADAAVASFIA